MKVVIVWARSCGEERRRRMEKRKGFMRLRSEGVARDSTFKLSLYYPAVSALQS